MACWHIERPWFTWGLTWENVPFSMYKRNFIKNTTAVIKQGRSSLGTEGTSWRFDRGCVYVSFFIKKIKEYFVNIFEVSWHLIEKGQNWAWQWSYENPTTTKNKTQEPNTLMRKFLRWCRMGQWKEKTEEKWSIWQMAEPFYNYTQKEKILDRVKMLLATKHDSNKTISTTVFFKACYF